MVQFEYYKNNKGSVTVLIPFATFITKYLAIFTKYLAVLFNKERSTIYIFKSWANQPEFELQRNTFSFALN